MISEEDSEMGYAAVVSDAFWNRFTEVTWGHRDNHIQLDNTCLLAVLISWPLECLTRLLLVSEMDTRNHGNLTWHSC